MADLSVRISRYARSPIGIVSGLPTLTQSVSETLHVVSDTVTRTWQGSGIVTFVASAGHATVTNYTARLMNYPVETLEDSVSLGVPTPDGNFVITADLTSFFAAQTAGDYTLEIRATDAGGFTDSPNSSPFTLPLP